MNRPIRQQKTLRRLITFVLMCSLLIPIHTITADHLPGTDASDPPLRFIGPLNNNQAEPCRNLDTILENREFQIQPGNVGSGAGEVPVYDNDASSNLVALINAMIRESEFTEEQDGDVQRTAEYLRLLCEKEYEEDHTLQHAWANLIGEFVIETQRFVTTGFNGNPAFLTNQNIYYQLVTIATARVLMQDIVDSPNMGTDAKIILIEAIADNLFQDRFPTNVVLAPDNPVGTFEEQVADEEIAINAVKDNALEELNRRVTTQLEQEQEKLAWGRGFFSYEICDLGVFVNSDGDANEEDRRNCRITTPGALIQDQTSFVFGSALRQMELNDEYEEWIAPNTLAVLNDILGWRGLTNILESRNFTDISLDSTDYENFDIPPTPAGPVDVRNIVDIETARFDRNGLSIRNPNNSGPLPYEFGIVVDSAFFDFESGQFADRDGQQIFEDVLDSRFFIDQLP